MVWLWLPAGAVLWLASRVIAERTWRPRVEPWSADPLAVAGGLRRLDVLRAFRPSASARYLRDDGSDPRDDPALADVRAWVADNAAAIAALRDLESLPCWLPDALFDAEALQALIGARTLLTQAALVALADGDEQAAADRLLDGVALCCALDRGDSQIATALPTAANLAGRLLRLAPRLSPEVLAIAARRAQALAAALPSDEEKRRWQAPQLSAMMVYPGRVTDLANFLRLPWPWTRWRRARAWLAEPSAASRCRPWWSELAAIDVHAKMRTSAALALTQWPARLLAESEGRREA